MVKKVIGAILVLLVLFSVPALAKARTVSARQLYSLKAQMDTSVLVNWWVWKLAVASGDQQRAWFAYALLEQAMTGAAAFDNMLQTGVAVSSTSYRALLSGARYSNRAATYLYRGNISRAFNYFSRSTNQTRWLPAPAQTNSMFYSTLNYIKNYTLYVTTGSHNGGSCDDGNVCTQNDTWSNGQCVGNRPMSPINPGC
ncbi:MAG: hypothetical protein D3914_05610 [Candidatus Electrothrix sp. LOE2]|nr:hypothetical protein [Candidatus Electrothrix sp. LOE2]